MKKSKIIFFSIFSVFIFVFAFIFTNFNLSAYAQVIPSEDILVPLDNTAFYNNYYLLDYIESTSNQYIDTGVNSNGNLSIDVNFLNTTTSSYAAVFGARTSVSGSSFTNNFTFYNISESSLINKRFRYGTGSTVLSVTNSNLNVKTHVIMNNNSISISYNDYSKTVSYSSQSFTSSNSLYLCATHSSNSGATDLGMFKIYDCKIYNNGVLVRNFVPAQSKSAGGSVGLYDLVNNRFYKSSSSSEFVAGSRIYSIAFYNNSILYNTQSFTSFSDFVLPSDPSVADGNTFVGWSLSNNNDINAIVDPSSVFSYYSKPLIFYSVVVSDDYLSGYNNAKNTFDGFGPFLYSNYGFTIGSTDQFNFIEGLTGRVSSPDFIGYGGGVILSDSLWSRVDEYEFEHEVDTTLVFTFDTPIPVSKYTNFSFNNNFQFGNGAIFYFTDGTTFTFSYDDGLGNFIDLSSYTTRFISRIRLTYASSIGDYGQGLGVASNPSYLESYNNGFRDGKDFAYPGAYADGLKVGKIIGYDNGYSKGLSDGSDYSFFGLFGAVLDAPVQAVKGLLNFELLGVNLLSLFTGLLTLALILLIFKLIRGG